MLGAEHPRGGKRAQSEHAAAWERGGRTARCPPAAPPRPQSPVLFEADLYSAFAGKTPTAGSPGPSTFAAVIFISEESGALCHLGPCHGAAGRPVRAQRGRRAREPQLRGHRCLQAAGALGFSTLQGSHRGHRVQGLGAGSSEVTEPNGHEGGAGRGQRSRSPPGPVPGSAVPTSPQLQEDELRDAVLLVFANKQDMPNAMAVSELTDKLGLQTLRSRTVSARGPGGASGPPRGVRLGARSPPRRLPPLLLPLFCSGTCRQRVPRRARASTTGWTGCRTSSPSASCSRQRGAQAGRGRLSQPLFSLGSFT